MYDEDLLEWGEATSLFNYVGWFEGNTFGPVDLDVEDVIVEEQADKVDEFSGDLLTVKTAIRKSQLTRSYAFSWLQKARIPLISCSLQ